MKKIAIANDQGGFELKKSVIEVVKDEFGYDYEDFGSYSSESVNYPQFAQKACDAVVSGACDLGILICGTGIGISMAANKVKGIRAAVCCDPVCSHLTRLHNDANVLAMGGRIVGVELAKEIVREFLKTEFEGGRHQTRVDMITAIENGEKIY